jgi:hypothetical protein
MKKNEDFEKEVQFATRWNPILNATEPGVMGKMSRHLKKIIVISSLAGIGLFLNSCVTGYVVTEPSYVQVTRPQRPSVFHIWIDGDWVWSRQSHAYVQRNGFWKKPNKGQVFITGSWQGTPRGKYWVPGHWERKNHLGGKPR